MQDNEGNNLYTRNGSFTVNATGEVLSSGGFRVLDAAGNPLVLEEPTDDLAVDGLGNLLDPATGLPSGTKLGISIVSRPQELIRDGNGVFHADDANAAQIRYADAGDNLQLRQGYIEGSNVDATQVTVDMNAAYRAYEANQKVIQFYDSSLQKAVNEIGRI